ncbi:hypothetical protein [Aureispira anguillae]|uniref:Uncharacterized protein n=1 Tax=Aureispira anguillae TaxID=2864201 RepID=A0A915YG31_9BACT|nr:hypothetical protein [Aureispira anguillae]BDS12493.1 hypothetical protein AsAng_0032160 [Aureispira anguillae]
MLKLLLLIISFIFIVGCTETTNSIKTNAPIKKPHTTQENALLKSFLIKLYPHESIDEDHIKKIQHWHLSLPQKVLEKIDQQQIIIKISAKRAKNYLNDKELAKIQEDLQYYEETLHKIIGDINLYPIALITTNIAYQKTEENYLEISLIEICGD